MTKEKHLTELEKKISKMFLDNLTDKIDTYCADNSLSLLRAAESLGYPRGTVMNWKNQHSTPGWEAYFTFMLKIEGQDSTTDAVKLLCLDLADFFEASIRKHCDGKGVYITQFAEDVGFSRSAFYTWINSTEAELPRPRDLIKVVSAAYSDVVNEHIVTADEVFRPLHDLDYLHSREYQSLTDMLLNRDARAMVTVPKIDPPAVIVPEYAPPPAAQKKKGVDEQKRYNSSKEPELYAILTLLSSYKPKTGKGWADFSKEVLMQVKRIVDHYRSSDADDREELRNVTADATQALGWSSTEARQLIGPEESYQEFLAMNRIKPGGRKK